MTRLEQLFDGTLPRLVMFDLDGTLMDSTPTIIAATADIAKTMPMAASVVDTPDNPYFVAFRYGPVVLSANLGEVPEQQRRRLDEVGDGHPDLVGLVGVDRAHVDRPGELGVEVAAHPGAAVARRDPARRSR